MTDRMIENRVHALESLDARIKALEEQRERKRAELIAELQERDAEELRTERGCEIKYTLIINRRFDSETFKAEHAGLYESYRQPSVTHRFTYKA